MRRLARRCCRNRRPYFNPRTPYGMRHVTMKNTGDTMLFQSTHPVRDATKAAIFGTIYAYHFNPRTPYGMRPDRKGRGNVSGDFNPRTPYGMRHKRWVVQFSYFEFQSTHPVRDATINRATNGPFPYIFQSTHPVRDATRPGAFAFESELEFQSTHPVRDATQPAMRQGNFRNFNPRTPYGMRRRWRRSSD